MTSPLVRADCKIVEVSLHAREGDPAYQTRALFKVLEVVPATVDDVVAGVTALGGATRYGSAFLSADSGANWEQTTTWTAGMALTLGMIEAENGNLFLTTGSNTAGKLGEIWRSQNRGLSWTRVEQHASERYFWGIGEAENGDILAGTANVGEFWRSQDGGDSWAKVDQTAANRAIKCIARAANDDLIAGVGGTIGEFYRSQDNGANWALVQQVLPDTGGYVECITLLSNGTLLAGTSYLSAQIWQSTDNGATWAKLSTLPGESYVYDLVQDENGIVYAGSGGNCKVWRSHDNGATWLGLDLSNLGTYVWSLCVLSNGDILAGTNIEVDDAAQIWRTTNQGSIWSLYSTMSQDNMDGVRCLLRLSEE